MPKLKHSKHPDADLITRIRGEMSAQHVPQYELAESLGIGKNTLADRLRNPEKLTLGDLRKISSKLGIPAEDVRGLIRFG